MKKILPFAMLASLFFAQCKVTKYTPDKLPVNQVIFGNGGGFVGAETSYTLLENGQIFKQMGVEGKFEELRSIKPKAAKKLFEKVNAIQLYKMDIQKPGNLYYFMQQVNQSIDSRVTWGAGDYTPPQSVISVFKDLQALARNQEVVKEGKKETKKTEGKDETKPNEEELKW